MGSKIGNLKPSFCIGVFFVSVSFIVRIKATSSATSLATSLGSCFRVRYESAHGCDLFLKTGISLEHCCGGHHRRAWTPNAPPTPSQGHELQGHRHLSLRSSSAASHSPGAWFSPGGGAFPSFGDAEDGRTCQPCATSCEGVRCGEDKECILRNGLPKCVCSPKCYLQHKSAVCGTDGRTYSSECQLLKRSCRKKKQLYVEHSGPCQTCKGVKCKKKRTCILDELLTPRCTRCPLTCYKSKKKIRYICGTDGVTYESKCLLKMASCKAGVTISKAYKGPCRDDATCDNVKCWRGEACLRRSTSKEPQCLWCGDLRDCPVTTTQICASDSNMYHSWCALRHASCRARIALTAIPLHYCERNNSASTDKMGKDCPPTPDIKATIDNKIYANVMGNSNQEESYEDLTKYFERLKNLEVKEQTKLKEKGLQVDHRRKLNKSKRKRKKKERERNELEPLT